MRSIPAYGVAEASWILDLPEETLRYWTKPLGNLPPVIIPADTENHFLSFYNLVEAHVLASLRRKGVKLHNIRQAAERLRRRLGSAHPFATREFATDGKTIFLSDAGLEDLKDGQFVSESVLMPYLSRIISDRVGAPVYFFPLIKDEKFNKTKSVIINPNLSFGRPVLQIRPVRTEVIANRYVAGDSLNAIAEDLDLATSDIEKAILYERKKAA